MKEFDELKEIINKLRSPGGCPWDRQQTHQSLLSFLYEESYEVGDAIINKNKDELKEELGDLLLQIMLHSRIAEENSEFDIKDVISILNEKLIRRHPHVFSDKNADNSDQVLEIWESVKKEEKEKRKSKESILDHIPNNFHPILKSYKIQKEASKVGFDWNNHNEVLLKIEEELNELKNAIKIGDQENIEHELGDLLFTIVNISRFLHVKPDVALVKANLRFSKRFNYIEKKLKEQNKNFQECSLDELEKLWQEAKNEK